MLPLIGRVIFIVASATVVTVSGGGMTFLRRPVGMIYLILWSIYWIVITLWRKPGKPSAHEEKQWVRFVLGAVFVFIFTILAPLEYANLTGPIPRDGVFSWIGITLFAFGIILLTAAMKSLHGFFTIQMGTQAGHHLVMKGPYGFIRHPGYLSYILSLTGMGLALGSLSALGVLFPTFVFLVWRIRREEAALIEEFGNEYRSYAEKTKWRLLPGIY